MQSFLSFLNTEIPQVLGKVPREVQDPPILYRINMTVDDLTKHKQGVRTSAPTGVRSFAMNNSISEAEDLIFVVFYKSKRWWWQNSVPNLPCHHQLQFNVKPQACLVYSMLVYSTMNLILSYHFTLNIIENSLLINAIFIHC